MLLEYQKNLISKMEFLEMNNSIDNISNIIETRIGICNNDYGSGKTRCILELIFRDNLKNNVKIFKYTKSFNNGLINIKSELIFMDSTLIVVNPLILCQWIDEIIQYYSNLTFFIIDKNNKIDQYNIFSNYDIIFCIPSFYNRLLDITHKYYWKRFIYDEPITTKIYNMKKINSLFIWIICPFPNELINYYHKHSIFTSDITIDIINNISISSIDSIYSILEKPTIIKYNYSDNNNDSLRQKFLRINHYENNLDLFKLLNTNYSNNCDSFFNYIKNQYNQIDLYQQYKNKSNSNECSICYNSIDNEYIYTFCCFQKFCIDCYLKWIKINKNCPICRIPILYNQIVYINNNIIEHYYTQLLPTKDEIIKDIYISKINDSKILIYTNDLSQLKNILNLNNIPYIELSGNVIQKNKKIIQWKTNNDINKILIINCILPFIGLNLPEITDIIFFQYICENKQHKVISLANRLSRKKSLSIHYLF